MLTTLEAVKTELALTGSEHDQLITRLISAVTAQFERVTNRRFTAERLVEQHTTRTGRIHVRQPPVRELLSPGIVTNADWGEITTGPGSVTIEYEGGFEEIPADLADLATRAVAHRINTIGVDASLTRERDGERTQDYDIASLILPTAIKAELERWRIH